MNHSSEDIGQLAAALSRAQEYIENPPKNKKVKVATRAGGSYTFEYADLTAIRDVIRKPLADNQLSYVQLVFCDNEGKFRLQTKLMHASGQWISGETPLLVDDRDNQSFGSALTFMKRYSLAAMLGVVADSDDDANSADGNTAEISDKRPKKPADNVIAIKAEPLEAQKPYKIPVPKTPDNQGNDWVVWGGAFSANINRSMNQEDVKNWVELNSEELQKMDTEAPKVRKRVADILVTAYKKLGE